MDASGYFLEQGEVLPFAADFQALPLQPPAQSHLAGTALQPLGVLLCRVLEMLSPSQIEMYR